MITDQVHAPLFVIFFESLGRGKGFNYFLLAVANAYQKKSEHPQ